MLDVDSTGLPPRVIPAFNARLLLPCRLCHAAVAVGDHFPRTKSASAGPVSTLNQADCTSGHLGLLPPRMNVNSFGLSMDSISNTKSSCAWLYSGSGFPKGFLCPWILATRHNLRARCESVVIPVVTKSFVCRTERLT